MVASLMFGSIDLLEYVTDDFTIECTDENGSWGSPEAVVQTVESWLQDGAVVATTRYDNREMTLQVAIKADTTHGLSLGEAVLVNEIRLANDNRNTLEWTPPGDASTSVFDLVQVQLAHNLQWPGEFDDCSYFRVYEITFTALPFARAVDQVDEQIASGTIDPNRTTVDGAASTAGWSVALGDTLTRSAGPPPLVFVHGQSNNPTFLQRSGLSVSAKKYLITDTFHNVYSINRTYVNGTLLTPLFKYAVNLNEDITYYDLDAAGISSINTVRYETDNPSSVQGDMGSYGIYTSDTIEITTKERVRVFDVTGTERTPASLGVFSSPTTSSLGDVLVYTIPTENDSIVDPRLSFYQTAGSSSTLPGNLSGRAFSTSPLQFDIPAGNFQPGIHLLMARVVQNTPGSWFMSWSVSSLMGSTERNPTVLNVTGTTTSLAYFTAPIGLVSIPPSEMGPLGKVRVKLLASTSGSVSTSINFIDQAWLFNIDKGQLSSVACGTTAPSIGGSSSKIWFDSADIGDPTPNIVVGTLADRSDSVSPNAGSIGAFGAHEFKPPQVSIYASATNPTSQDITLSHFPRFHTHVS